MYLSELDNRKGGCILSENRNKGGRPFAENPLCIDVKVRLTEADAQRLDAFCKKHGTRRAIAIRRAVLQMLDADQGET